MTMVAAVTTAVTPPPQPLESPDECGSAGSVDTRWLSWEGLRGLRSHFVQEAYSLVGRPPPADKEVKSKMSELVDPDLEGTGIPRYEVWAVLRAMRSHRAAKQESLYPM